MFESPPYMFIATVFGLAVLVGFLPARKYRTTIIGCIALGPLGLAYGSHFAIGPG
jgi:hypothetical protein